MVAFRTVDRARVPPRPAVPAPKKAPAVCKPGSEPPRTPTHNSPALRALPQQCERRSASCG
jgi:hypothetical protein